MGTYSPTINDLKHDWFVVDADNKILGRLASKVSHLLMGKHKPDFAYHMDNGDFIIIINADKIKVTGNKAESKIYYRHTGYPGGIKSTNLKSMMTSNPERVIEIAVKGMLPKNKLGRKLFTKLKVYAGPEHPHQAQQPKILDL
ncbi:MAG: 50S ribosomal protein L13 [Candidatus Marinimicrobia bacterium]|nr:50S ribosomal protein L13 [Candidatus Neomarinimicrobiota bacterium]